MRFIPAWDLLSSSARLVCVCVCVTSSVGVYFVAAGREVTSGVPLFVEKSYQRVFVSQFVLVCV